MKDDFPTREEAETLLEEGIAYRLSRPYPCTTEAEYRFHVHGVAEAAFKIAAHIKGMNPEKAYIMGLLHDYGKRIGEQMENRFHGIEGYCQMMKKGYPEIAQICLTHSFPIKDFEDDDFSWPKAWKDEVRQLLKNMVYSDYDLLIALCDKFFEAMSLVTLEERIEAICRRYQLNRRHKEALRHQSFWLKNYFDAKTGKDIYEILGLKTNAKI